ncbi:MAG: tetratricopeptide repeat protein [Marinicaulis sp.]|nr:tetratricopeptide repeat protein [Marinicaulis sp.]
MTAGIAASGCMALPQENDSVVGDYLSGRYAARVQNVDGAASSYSSAHINSPSAPSILRDAFFFQLAAGEIEKALVFAKRLTESENAGDDGLARTVLAADAIKKRQYEIALALLEEPIPADYLQSTAKIIKAWAIEGKSGAGEALTALQDSFGTEYKGFYPLHQALLAQKALQIEDARASHEMALMAFGGSVEHAAYGAFLERAGDDAETKEFYELLANDPGPSRHMARQGLARVDNGGVSLDFMNSTPAEGVSIAFYSLANAILQQASSQRAAAERAGFNVGAANYNMPLVLTQLAIHLDPSFDDAQRFAGAILNAYGDNEKAVEHFLSIEKTSPFYEQSRIEIAAAYAALKRDDEAIRVLRSVVRDDPKALEARLSLSGLYAARDRHGDAVKVLDELIARLPEKPETDAWRYFISRAAANLELDEWEKAQTDLEYAVELAPEEATTLNYLGYSWAERGLNLEKAFELIEKAVALEPQSGAIIDSLGWAHYQLGNYDEAIVHLEKAASLEPGDPTITDHLGDIYWQKGRAIEARYQWRRVLELEPDEKTAASVREKIENGLTDADK